LQFGDITDVTWWRELALPVRAIIQANGAFKPVTWGSAGWETTMPSRRSSTTTRAGLSAAEGAHAIVERSAKRGSHRRAASDHAPREVLREGRSPLEIVTSRQWFIKTMDFREECWRAGASSRGIRRTCARGTRTG
jgi:valyl-tRNA synthetase